MHRIRLRFSKGGALRFIGHLDLQNVFHRTVRRAELPASYSQGFNPHLLLSFALPLPLGMESVNDYADLTLDSDMSGVEMIERLNAHAPAGLVVKAAYPTENKAAAIVVAADYAIDLAKFSSDLDEISQNIQALLTRESIVIPKKTKNGIKDTDIRPDILGIDLSDSGILMRLSAGSMRFIHPLVVAELILGKTPSPDALQRLELYQNAADGLVSL